MKRRDGGCWSKLASTILPSIFFFFQIIPRGVETTNRFGKCYIIIDHWLGTTPFCASLIRLIFKNGAYLRLVRMSLYFIPFPLNLSLFLSLCTKCWQTTFPTCSDLPPRCSFSFFTTSCLSAPKGQRRIRYTYAHECITSSILLLQPIS